MGAWGCGNLENDDALDWLGAMFGCGGVSAVTATLREAVGPHPLDAPDASRALAACEVVAAALGHPHPLIPLQVHVFVETWRPVLVGLRQEALHAVHNVRQNSELQELWEEFGADGWYRELEDLERRL